MTWEKFWSIIDRVRAQADMQDEASVNQFLYTELINLPQDELLGFDCAWQSYRNKANFPKMVAAACIINDGSSDDRFTDFRNWLIMQGYDAYRQAMIDPDNLAALNIPFRDTEWMGCGNVAWYAYSTILQPFRQDMQCGCCDERLYWHPKTNQWFCRRCGMWAKPLRAEETSAAIAEKLCWLRQNPEIIHTPEGQANVQSVEVALLDREIWQALTNAEPDVDALVAKILHRAEMEYKFCTAGDADPVTLQIQKACAEYKPTEEFPETFYKEVISKVILYRDTHIEFKLQNGQIV